jgi:hypothetical protein
MRSPSRSRVSSSRLRLGKLTLLSLVALLVLPVISSAQQVPNDVGIRSATDRTSSRPDDGLHYAVRTNSPRETFSSFQQVSAKFKIAFADYKNMKDRQRAENIYFVADQWRSLIDLSEVPVATRRSVGALTAAYLLDICKSNFKLRRHPLETRERFSGTVCADSVMQAFVRAR